METTKQEIDERFVSLATLNRGAAIEQFDRELDLVLQNVLDPNTRAESKREVTLKITITPAENRRHADVAIAVTSKLAAQVEGSTVFFIGSRRGHAVAAERDMTQLSFLDQDFEKPILMPTAAEGTK